MAIPNELEKKLKIMLRQHFRMLVEKDIVRNQSDAIGEGERLILDLLCESARLGARRMSEAYIDASNEFLTDQAATDINTKVRKLYWSET